MKHVLWISLLAACALDEPDLGTVEQRLNGDTWINSDLLQAMPYANPSDVAFAVDPLGIDHDLYLVGTNDAGTRWTFRTSVNGGITYTAGPTFSLAQNKPARAQKIAVGHDGRILVSGIAYDTVDRPHLITRLSTDKGSSWTIVDDVIFNPAAPPSVSALVFQANGQATLAGLTLTGPILRRSKPLGTLWAAFNQPAAGVAVGGLCTTGADLLATGTSASGAGVTYRYSGSTWTLLDSFSSADYDGASACTESHGRLFVGGRQGNHWIVRRSINGGASWATVDSVFCDTYGPISDMGPGRDGRTYIVGQCRDNGTARWRTRRTDNGGTTWLDSDLPTTTTTSYANGYAFDAATGDTTVVGAGISTGVRRLD